MTVEIDGHSAQTDRTGRFLLTLGTIAGGWHELVIDGSSANHGRRRFGIFEYGLSIVAKRTNVLPFTIWMPVLDTANAVHIQSPTRQATVITTPHIPGLELHLPAGTVITDEDGRIVREITITPIPVDRPPFPLPNGVQVPIYFTIQPGGAYLEVFDSPRRSRGRSDAESHRMATAGMYASGAYLVYPNYTKQPVNQRIPFWHYDPEHNGWHVYGHGRVTPDGQQVRPYPGVVLYEFTGAMIGVEQDPPGDLPPGPDGGDPVHLATGTFVMEKVDLVLHDVIPIVLKRTYRTNDDAVRPFGVGGQHPYDMWFDNQGLWFESDLILPNGTRIHYAPISTGPGTKDVILEHTSTPTQFYGSRVVYNGSGWDLTMKDGTTYVFGVEAPLQKIRDRFGNTLTITRTGGPNGNIAKITSPHGRYIEFTYDSSDRITQAKDNLGRTVNYTYDTAGRVATVTDVMGGVTEYTYDGAHRMLTIEDPRNIVYLENEYDTAGRVIRQTQADGGEYEFEYTVNGGGQIIQTDLTNPRGFVRRLIFDSAGYLSSETHAFGQSIKQETTYSRLSGSHLPETISDELDRVTTFEYDTKGNPTSVIRLDGTADEQPTTFTYEPTYNQLATVTDALNHTTTFTYGAQGRLAAVSDALNHSTTFTSNAAGQMVSATSAVNTTTSFGYDVGDLVQMASPLGHVASGFVDAVGRVTQVTDARGGITRLTYNHHDQVTAITDPLGAQTTFTYDGNGNLLTLTDARSKTTTWTYNNMDRVDTRTDPLNRTESFEYDLNGNLTKWTDRKGQVTVYQYDALDRPTLVGFGATGTPPVYASTITATYDAGNRVTESSIRRRARSS